MLTLVQTAPIASQKAEAGDELDDVTEKNEDHQRSVYAAGRPLRQQSKCQRADRLTAAPAQLSGAAPPNRASRATIASLPSDRPDAARTGDAYGDQGGVRDQRRRPVRSRGLVGRQGDRTVGSAEITKALASLRLDGASQSVGSSPKRKAASRAASHAWQPGGVRGRSRTSMACLRTGAARSCRRFRSSGSRVPDCVCGARGMALSQSGSRGAEMCQPTSIKSLTGSR
jgi:hypothetical protein